jgi:hypothetical protein
MPRNPDHRQINATVSRDQHNALETARVIAGEEKAQFIRQSIAERCQRLGVEWPDDLMKRGTYKRKKSIDA